MDRSIQSAHVAPSQLKSHCRLARYEGRELGRPILSVPRQFVSVSSPTILHLEVTSLDPSQPRAATRDCASGSLATRPISTLIPPGSPHRSMPGSVQYCAPLPISIFARPHQNGLSVAGEPIPCAFT